MRPIKFRAWYKKEDRWLDDGEFQVHPDGELATYGLYCHPVNDLVLMQFTGLKDKNGKEIYEGDVVKGVTTLPMEIIHQGHQYGVGYIAPEGPQAEPITTEFLAYMREENWEVIGNIYENPELLK